MGGKMDSLKVAVVGAGTMGSAIAVAFAGSGFSVLLKETSEKALANGLAHLDRIFAQKIKKGLSNEEAEKQRNLIETTLDYEAFSDIDFVIEATFESIEVKEAVFKELDQWCNIDAIIATNTSSLSISQIANFTRRPDKIVGMHFFNPAHIMKLVEVIPGLETSHETVKTTLELGESLGKLAVRVEECASFLVNRLLGRYMNESLWALQNGLAGVEEIDRAACDFAMPMGPLALRDMNGADIGLAVARFNYNEYGERFAVPDILTLMVEENMLGAKTLGGFYSYDSQTRKRQGLNPQLACLLSRLTQSRRAGETFESQSLFLPMINEAFLLLQERICAPEDLDPALMAGLGMRKGPLTMAGELGLASVLKQLEEAFEKEESSKRERFRPAPLLKRFVWAGRTSVL
jgi:3-hydroxyacyl-CoA dehydrogenase